MHPGPSPWWRGRWFLRLLAVRVTGQGGDGLFQAGLASYALFSDDRASATELAVATAVLLLPYSLLGPWAGVLLDRWSRRQVLVLGNVLRAAVLGLLSWTVLTDLAEPLVYGVALAALGINRFLLAGLSASLPHTVPEETLTDANAVTPTLGTAAFAAGLGVGAAVRGATGAGDEAVLALAAGAYLLAGALALRIPRLLLGPDEPPQRRSRPAPAHLAAGLAAGLRHLRTRRRPAAALGALTSMRLWFGLVTVSAVLTLRNGAVDEDAAFAALGGLTVATAAGFLAAAVLTPPVSHRLGRTRTAALALVVAAAAPLLAVLSAEEPAWWGAGALLGLGAQGTKICVDAVVQAEVDDDVRGRVFAVYDMAFNMAFVLAAAMAALVLPPSGRSAPVLLTCVAGLLVTAGFLERATRAAGISRPRSAP